MKATAIFTIPVLSFILFSSCSNRERKDARYAQSSESAPSTADTTAMPEEAAIAALNDPARKIIKTASMRCRVANVLTAVTDVEHNVLAAGGMIVQSDTRNEPASLHRLPYGHDSLIQVQAYTTTSSLTLKVPVNALDTLLNAIARDAAFIDNRHLNLDDVTLQYLSNQLKNEAMHNEGTKAQQLARRTSDAIDAGECGDQKKQESIDRKIANLGMQEQVVYATLHLELYQPDRVDKVMIPDTDKLMKAPFGLRLRTCLAGGWVLLLDTLLLLIRLWPLLLAAFAGWMIYKSRKAKTRTLLTAFPPTLK